MVPLDIWGENERSHTHLYKELESINFSEHLHEVEVTGNIRNATGQNDENLNEFSSAGVQGKVIESSTKTEDNYTVFRKAMTPLMFWGQFWGMNPVIGIFEKDPSRIRFNIYSWQFCHSVLILTAQAILIQFCLFKIFTGSANVNMFSFLSFYGSCGLTTYLFIRSASKWPAVVREVATCQLDEYTDQRLKFRCYAAFIILLSMATLEHILSCISNFTIVLDCFPQSSGVDDVFKAYIEIGFPFIFGHGLPYHQFAGIVLQFLIFTCTVNWNYSDLFIISISFYLSSILRNINKKLNSVRGKRLPSSFWRSLREDYTRATRLVRVFDNVINSIIFVSFATSLFFICLQLFKVMSKGVRHRGSTMNCPNFPSGPFGGYEHAVYYTFSLAFILGRSLTVSLVSANVHTTSLGIAPTLYDVPSDTYCSEIQRFVEQVHGDKVALSGLHFFYISRGLVLSIAGTVVTYELVLLQFNGVQY